MYTSNELQLLRNADPGVQIPGIDTPAGNPLPQSALKPLSAITGTQGFYYVPSQNIVYVTQPGTVLSGYDFGTATVAISASDVTIRDCNFSATTGYFAVQTYNNATNTTVIDSTFDSKAIPARLDCWISSSGSVNVIGNRFIDTPADGVDVTGGGVISGNYFSGSGYTSNGQHPDAIWITKETAPMTISNNFIDWSTNASSVFGTNNCIRITGEAGPVSNLTVTGNYLLNGTTSVSAVYNSSQWPLTNVSITNNYIGFAPGGAFYPGSNAGVTSTGNVVFDYTNPSYSTKAWAAYQAAGLPTATTLVSTNGSTVDAGGSAGPTTLYAGQIATTMFGGGHENNFVGGYGGQNMWAGTGANVFTYLAPSDSTGASPDWITNFDPAKDVLDFSHVDANAAPGVQQAFSYIGNSAFTGAGAQIRWQQNAATNQTIVQATMAGDTTPDMQIVIAGLVPLTAANFALTPAQSTAALANGAAVSTSVSSYWPLTEYQHAGVQGRSYSSYTSIQEGSYLVADVLDLSPSTGQINLFNPSGGTAGAVTISRAGGQESISGSGKTDPLVYHPTEMVQAGGGTADTFALGKGFGNETIVGFAVSGARADTLQLSAAAFAGLTPGMSQSQQLAAVLANVSNGPNGATISDSFGDHLTLVGVSAATLAANPSAVRFV